MGMADPLPTFSYVIAQLAARHPALAYIHLVEPRINGNATRINGNATRADVGAHESNDALRALWAPRPLVRAGCFTREGALEAAEGGDLVAFGRLYISNVRVLCGPFNTTAILMHARSPTCRNAWRRGFR